MANRFFLIFFVVAIAATSAFIIIDRQRTPEIRKDCGLHALKADPDSKEIFKNRLKIIDIVSTNSRFIPYEYKDGMCIAKSQDKKDGILNCFYVSGPNLEEFLKICLAPRGALYSIETR